MAEELPSSIHQTIGSLNAKADQSRSDIADLKLQASRDIGELRTGQADLKAQIAALPLSIHEVIEKAVGERLDKVEQRLANVETTVNRWKGVVAFLAFSAAGIGWLLSHLSLRKIFGAE